MPRCSRNEYEKTQAACARPACSSAANREGACIVGVDLGSSTLKRWVMVALCCRQRQPCAVSKGSARCASVRQQIQRAAKAREENRRRGAATEPGSWQCELAAIQYAAVNRERHGSGVARGDGVSKQQWQPVLNQVVKPAERKPFKNHPAVRAGHGVCYMAGAAVVLTARRKPAAFRVRALVMIRE